MMSVDIQTEKVVEANESTVERIRKLLALAQNNPNENERAVAMKFALDLLSKHNLSISQIEKNSSMFDVVEEEVHFNLEPWVRMVLNASCCLYYTNYYIKTYYDFYGRRKRRPVIVGTRENIDVTVDVAEWLWNSIRLESNRKYKDQFQRRSFRKGAADKVFDRALEIVAEETFSSRDDTTGSELMVIRMKLEKAVDDYMSKLNLRETKLRGSYIDYDAYQDGESYGQNIKLGNQKSANAGDIAALPLFK